MQRVLAQQKSYVKQQKNKEMKQLAIILMALCISASTFWMQSGLLHSKSLVANDNSTCTAKVKPNQNSESATAVPAGYVDLGLPSGTLWKATNEDTPGGCDYYTAVRKYGNKLPTQEQWMELWNYGTWKFDARNSRCVVTGRNGKYISLPSTFGSSEGSHYGYYWSSTSYDYEKAWCLEWIIQHNNNQSDVTTLEKTSMSCSVRLIYN